MPMNLRRTTGAAALIAALLGALVSVPAPVLAQAGAAAQKTAAKSAPAVAAGKARPAQSAADSAADQAIVVLVNDEPITAYEIAQRERLLVMMSGAVGEYVQKNIQSRWMKVVENKEKLTEEFRGFAMKHNPKSQEDVQRLQKIFIEEKQKRLKDEILREARAHAGQGARAKAQEELIEERLKLQEAKRLSLVVEDAEVNKVILDIAQRNKMTEAQFAAHIASQGGDIEVMKSRFRATLSWNQVIRRRFGHQISVADRDIDKAVAAGPAGEDRVEYQLQRILLPSAARADQKSAVLRLADADKVRAGFKGCKTIAASARAVPDAKVEDLGQRKPSSVPEPTRSMLLNAKDGDLLPPTVGADGGVEIWAVCGRSVVKASEEKRNAASDELRQREFELIARRHLKDLRQDASIEYR